MGVRGWGSGGVWGGERDRKAKKHCRECIFPQKTTLEVYLFLLGRPHWERFVVVVVALGVVWLVGWLVGWLAGWVFCS